MNGEILTIIFGAALSLALEYVPKVKDWFAKLTAGQKKQVNGLGITLVALAMFGLGCWQALELPGWFPAVACTQAGAWQMVAAWLAALGVNQGVHLLTKRQPDRSQGEGQA